MVESATTTTAPQRVLITGGGAGIGRAMAETFSAQGAQVWVTDRDGPSLSDLPPGWRGMAVDVADADGMRTLFDQITQDWGGLDVLCANAGTAGPTAKVEDVRLEDWRACVSVNLEGAFLAAQGAIPLMKRQGTGSSVLTSSTAGIFGYPNRAPYAAAKWAIIGFMKTLAMELGPYGIRANAICPGAVEGPRMEGVLAREAAAKGTTRDALYTGYASGTSMRCWVEARDIADMAAFLASDAARRVSGQVIAVDGHTENPDPKV